jgi:hypothetical protein
VLGAALSVVISAAFAIVMARRWSARRKPHEAAWAIGLAMFAVAAAAGVWRQSAGPTDLNYGVFYLFGAILNVAWLAQGTLYFHVPARVARASLWALVAFSVLAAVVVFVTPVDLAKAADTGRGFEAYPLPRILAGIGSGIGSLVLIGGALWSAWVFVTKRHNGRSALGNVIIAVGVLVAAAGGTAAFTGATGIVEWTNAVGVLLIFIGFLLV